MNLKTEHPIAGWLISSALSLVCALTAFGLQQQPGTLNPAASGKMPERGEQSRQASQPSGGQATYEVAKGDVIRNLYITGELKAARSIEISVPSTRQSFSVTVSYLPPEGALVKEGEKLVEFDSSALVSQKAEIERRLAENKLRIEKQKVDLEAQRCDLLNSVAQAEANLKVAQLYGKIPKDLLPSNTYQQYQVNLEKAMLSLQKAKEQLANFVSNYAAQMKLVELNHEQTAVELKRLDGDLAKLTVLAPQDGIVIYGDNWAANRKFQVGDSIFPGMPVVTLPDLSTMQVEGYVYDTELPFLERGMRCNFGLDAMPDVEHFQAAIASLTSVAGRKGFHSQQKVFKAVVRPDKVDHSVMKPGMTTHVEIPIKLAAGVMTAPREFIGIDAQRRYYVVLRGADAKKVSTAYVEVGAFGDLAVEILSGVNIGDTLLSVQSAAEDMR